MPFLAPLGAAAAATATAVGASAAVAAGIGGATTLLAAGGLGFLGFKAIKSLTDKPDIPSQPAPLPTIGGQQPTAAEFQKQADVKAQKERLELARRKRTGTILTSPQGLLSTSETVGKSLLGG